MLFWLNSNGMPSIPNGSSVKYWIDSSSNNRNAAQLGGLLQPKVYSNVVGSYKGLLMDGVNDFMDISDIGLEDDDDFTFVFITSGTTTDIPIVDCNSSLGGGMNIYIDSGNTINYNMNSVMTYSNLNEYKGLSLIFVSHLNQNPYGEYLFCRAFHTSDTTGNTSNWDPNFRTMHIGQLVGSPNKFFKGYFFEALGYKGQVSTQERNNLISYYQLKFGIS